MSLEFEIDKVLEKFTSNETAERRGPVLVFHCTSSRVDKPCSRIICKGSVGLNETYLEGLRHDSEAWKDREGAGRMALSNHQQA